MITIGVQAKKPLISSADSIRLNQTGFYPKAPKIAIVLSGGSQPFIIQTLNNQTVFTGRLKASAQPALSGKNTFIADFSSLNKAGKYVLVVPAVGVSYPFAIEPHVHSYVAEGAIKGFYYQRTDIALSAQYAGKWSRALGHRDDKVLIHSSAATAKRPEGTVISSPRGWYDAGDYNKYIVNSGITMGTLLSLYEDFPDHMKTVKLNIPESQNQVPDELDEVLWNLRWMLTMQDPDDGGVYHKLTNAAFDAMVMPDQAIKPRYVVQKGTAATLNFAAVMAQSARIFKNYNQQLPGLADSCQKAAVKAWQWAIVNPDVVYEQNVMNTTFKPEISTGAYGDRSFKDEFIWAACELYINTLDDTYLGKVGSIKYELPTWSQVGTLGYYSLLRNRNKLTSAGKKLLPELCSGLIAFADELLSGADKSAYQTVMGKTAKDFTWGSNSVAANQGVALVQAYLLTRKIEYLNAALTNIDYILGRNGTGYCYLTGFGSKQVMHPHHRPSIADGITEPVPGLLAGGPNPGRQDGVPLTSLIPDEAYADDDRGYATNEIAINWNAPFAYLANAIEALEKDN